MNRETRRLPPRRCRVAHGTIRRDIQSDVVRIGCLIKIRGVTTRASVRRIRVISLVAGVTIVRNRHVRPSEGVNGIVVKSRWCPGRFTVASGAIRWELSGSVVRIGGRVVVGRVTTRAGVWRSIVIAVVAARAIIGNARMCAVQRIIIIVCWETRRFPARRGGMAGLAIRR